MSFWVLYMQTNTTSTVSMYFNDWQQRRKNETNSHTNWVMQHWNPPTKRWKTCSDMGPCTQLAQPNWASNWTTFGWLHSVQVEVKLYLCLYYEGVSRSFRTGRLEREPQMIRLSATRCSCIATLWVSLVSCVAITLCVASQPLFIAVYFVIDSVRKLLDKLSSTPLWILFTKLILDVFRLKVILSHYILSSVEITLACTPLRIFVSDSNLGCNISSLTDFPKLLDVYHNE